MTPTDHAEEPCVLRHTTPCNECPFRREHPAGWLGGYPAEDFINRIQFDGPPLPCHKTLTPEEIGERAPSMCAGALIFMKNTIKSARHPDFGDALAKVHCDTANVFQWSREFLAHHADTEGWIRRAKEKISAKAPS